MIIRENSEYAIRVSLTPHPWDNAKKPYFWWVSETSPAPFDYILNDDKNTQIKKGDYQTCNTGCCGWAETPEQAWKEARETWNGWIEME